MIPKIAFTYWEGKQFSPLHKLTLETFLIYNPDLEVIIYTNDDNVDINPVWRTDEHRIQLDILCDINDFKHRKNVKFQTIDFKSLYNTDIDSAVYRADIARIIKLYEHGGVWFDLDIFFTKKIPDAYFELDADVITFFYYNTIATGFVLAKKNSIICKHLADHIHSSIESMNTTKNYEQFGPTLWNDVVQLHNLGQYIILLPNSVIYPYLYTTLKRLYNDKQADLHENTIGIHWYNGASDTKIFINSYFKNHSIYNDSFFSKLIQDFVRKHDIKW